jgi:hypothetical protein
MRSMEDFVIDVGAILHRAETHPPIDAVQAVADGLGEMVGSRRVNLLIADFSGNAVVRLTSAGPVEGARSHGAEQAETLPLADTVYDGVLRTQQPLVEPDGDGARGRRPGDRPRRRDRPARDGPPPGPQRH